MHQGRNRRFFLFSNLWINTFYNITEHRKFVKMLCATRSRVSSLFGASLPLVRHRTTSSNAVLFSIVIQRSYVSIATRYFVTIPKTNFFTLIPTNKVVITQPNIFGSVGFASRIFNALNTTILRMSSTMKKRRAKMNKHKLRKRRKLLRRKSKG